MPFHFCQDEALALLSALPFLGAFTAWLRSKIRPRHTHTEEVPPCSTP
jgi:hypothetical protein